MPYDPRLPTKSKSPLHSPNSSYQTEFIELSPWDATDNFIDIPTRTYHSTDELLPLENDRLFQPSPPNSPNIHINENHSRVEGWKVGALGGLTVVSAVLILNLTVTAWAASSFGLSGGIGTMHEGPCYSVKHTGSGLHIAINVLSTMLLGASNYSMQCLSSPTRKEADKAHAEGSWLDVGIQSFRNLRKIGRMRMILWCLLAASSVPLHLMFNSAIFVSLTANKYIVAAVTEDFVNGASWTLAGTGEVYQEHHSILTEIQQNVSTYQRLDESSCIKEYGIDYLSARRHVLAVVSGTFANPLLGILDWDYNSPQNSWTCGTSLEANQTLETISIDDFDCSIPVALSNDTWLMADQPVEYCLSEQVVDKCRLQFALPIMVVVLGCNAVKLVCMILAIWRCKEMTFVTLGDALNNFLERPDETTRGMCTVGKKDFEGGKWPVKEPRRWVIKRYFRWEAVGGRRWIASNTACAAACIAATVLLRFAINYTTVASDIVTLWNLGLGTVTASSLIRWSTPLFGSPGLMKNVLLANSPQIILSFLYMLYNRIYTCMSFSKEFSTMSHTRLPLRVTHPHGSQRSTYFLSLPYHYLIPILLTSITTHFLLSQSLFLVAIDVFTFHGSFDRTESILTCGFSAIALIFLIGIGWLVFVVTIGMGFRRYERGMPLVGSCSSAISAACHAEGEERDIVALGGVRWGVTRTENGVGHCAFSGGWVGEPVGGRLYMGKVKGD